ncbi:MAG TPA: sortase [Candidatus Polarisedimenticolaceae bacterium]|nr:sortase [Candidatus Polarisedimenticolaceae bacterium]
MRRPARAAIVGILLLLPGGFLLARAGWVHAKGAVGEVLIGRALDATLEDGVPRKPWSWADMVPVARLDVPRLGVSRPILSNASGSALAFGLGRVSGTGLSIVAGHRDSWAAFLEDVKVGDELTVTSHERQVRYHVVGAEIVRYDTALRGDGLSLVTCWPFDGLLHSPWRYVVHCEPEGTASETRTAEFRKLSPLTSR